MAQRSHPEPVEYIGQVDSVFSAGRFALLAALLIVAMFPQVVTGFHTFMFRDYGLFSYPLAHYHRESFWKGEIPLWNPYNNLGIPHLAQWATMVLYPPSLIYLLLPLPWSLGVFCLVHLWFGGLGMYVLSSKWTDSKFAGAVAGIGFMFSGMTLNCLMWPHFTAALAWMPWVVYAVCRAWKEGGRRIFTASIFGALQMLSGMPEAILLTWLILGGLWICGPFGSWRQVWVAGRRFLVVVALVAALAAAQLLPFFELIRESDRNSNFSRNSWPVPLWGWANLFVPMFRLIGTECGVHFQFGQYFTTSYYTGLFPLVIAVVAMCLARDRRVWYFGGIVVLGLLLCMGDDALLYKWVRTAIPMLGFMRYPAKMVILVTFAVPVLAGFGIATLLHRLAGLESRQAALRWLRFLSGICGTMVVAIVVYAWSSPSAGEVVGRTILNGVFRVILLILTCGLLVWLTRARLQKPLLFWALPILVAIDLLTHVPQQNPTLESQVLTIKVPVVEQLSPRPRLGESRAMPTITITGSSNLTQLLLRQRQALVSNMNMLESIPKPGGFYPLYLRRQQDVYARLFASTNQPHSGLIRFVGISQMTSPTNSLAWESRRDYLPLVTIGQRPIFADDSETLDQLSSTNFVPESVVYLPKAAESQVKARNRAVAEVTSVSVAAHHVQAEVLTDAPTLVVIAQSHYKPWRATVDGHPAAIWRANHAFQGIEVGPGRHRVELFYRDRAFHAGVIISIVALLAGGLGLFAAGVRLKQPKTGAYERTPALSHAIPCSK